MQLMKRLFQFVVFALVLLAAAAQPLLADIACAQQRCGGIVDCSMHIGCMAIPDSAMQSFLASFQAAPQVAIAEAGCSYDSWWLAPTDATLLKATPPTTRLASSTTLLMRVAQFSASPVVNPVARLSEDAAVGAVPRHILFQVFRI
jgi:hypothetical protein